MKSADSWEVFFGSQGFSAIVSPHFAIDWNQLDNKWVSAKNKEVL